MPNVSAWFAEGSVRTGSCGRAHVRSMPGRKEELGVSARVGREVDAECAGYKMSMYLIRSGCTVM
jgi:hypothetical protein